MDRDEYIRLRKLAEQVPLIMVPATGPDETMRVRVNNTPTSGELNDIF
jgi:hypothetical protein